MNTSSKSAWLQNAGTAILVVCALTVTGLVVRQQFFSAPAAGPALTVVKDWQSFARDGNRMGPAKAKLTVVEFSDFQCPFCAQAHEALAGVRSRDPEIAVVYRHMPLDGHPHALKAAVASECAAEQGAFERYHDQLFRNQDSIGITSWDTFAARAGVGDVERFRACLIGEGARSRVNRDRTAALRLGARGTPTFIANGQMFSGSMPPGGWNAWIEANLESR